MATFLFIAAFVLVVAGFGIPLLGMFNPGSSEPGIVDYFIPAGLVSFVAAIIFSIFG